MENTLWSKYARVLVEYSVEIKPGDLTIIRATSHEAQPLVKEIYKQVLQKGGHPIVHAAMEGINETFIKYATDEQLSYIDPMTELEYKTATKFISIGAPTNTKAMAKADSQKMAKRSAATRELSNLMLKRSAEGSLKWVIADFPTNALAQEAKMSLEDYTDFLIKSCYLHLDNPIEKWREIDREQQRIADYLNTTSKLRITGEETDITFNTHGRKWLNCSGQCNFPDGEIYTSPVEDSANGTIYFDFPQIYRGNEAQKVRLRLENGKVVEASAEKGQDYFLDMINMDEGSRFVGEIAIGTNYMIQDITGNILFDEKIGGAIHMALGASYPEAGGKNVSGLHWDLIKNMKQGGEIYADDKLIYKDGQFVI